MTDFYSQPIVYHFSVGKPAHIHRDLVYKQVEGVDLKMDVYAPADLPAHARLPAVLFVHGGPLRPDLFLLPKDWGVFKSYATLMAASDLVGITFNHRFGAIEHLPKSTSDLDDALQFVRKNGNALKVDPQRLCLWGFSGGGPLLADALRSHPPVLRCLLAFYTRLDLRHAAPEALAKLSAEEVRRFSAIAALEEGRSANLPVFVARAGQDRSDLNATIDEFIQKALAVNIPISVLNHPKGRHAFDVLDDDARTREIIAAAVTFIKTHVL